MVKPNITIPTDEPTIAKSIVKCKPGEKVTIAATVTANDETGFGVDVDSITPDYAKVVRVKKQSPTAYAKSARRKRMGDTTPPIETMDEGMPV